MQVETPPLPDQRPGACCKADSCVVTGQAACLADKGSFAGTGSACSACAGPGNTVDRGACCTAGNKCSPGNTKAICDSKAGILHLGQECSICFGGGGSSGGGTTAPTSPVATSDRGNCCAKGSCYQQHTAASCAAVDAKARFIGSQQCLEVIFFQFFWNTCFQILRYLTKHQSSNPPPPPPPQCFQQDTDPTATAGCTMMQLEFCNNVCQGAANVLGCGCSPTSVKPTCTALAGPAPAPTTATTRLPEGATVAPLTNANGQTVPGQTMVDVAAPGGQTQGNGATITNRIVPITDASGNVVGTKVVAAATDPNNGQVLTDAQGNTVGTATFTPAPATNAVGNPVPSNSPNSGGFAPGSPGVGPSGGCTVDVKFCADVCGAGGIKSCDW